jgi:Ca2+-binding RTX toxin-like protein
MLVNAPINSRKFDLYRKPGKWLACLLRGRLRKAKTNQRSSGPSTEVLETRALLSASNPVIHTLFAEGTPESVVAKYEHNHDGETPTGEFNADDRWGSTASNGGGLGQGDPTTLTWSIAPDGTDIPGFNGEDDAPSDLIATLEGIYGSDSPNDGDLTNEPWFDEVERSLTRWNDVSGINYVYEPNDDGAAFSSSSGAAPGVLGTRGDVRIGGHNIDDDFGVLAYNFFPDNGEMVIDTADSFYSNTSNDSIRLRNVVSHEAGHGLGFSHVESSDSGFLMEPFLSTSFDGPQLDDVLAAHRNFGDANEFSAGNENTSTATSLGAIADGVTVSIGTDAGDTVVAATDTDFVSIDDDGDTDVFSFSVAADAVVDISLAPVGPTYEQGRQGGSQSTYDASSQSDLTLELLGTNGAVLATVNATGTGSGESLADFDLGTAGTYFARISGATSNVVQVYSLDVTVTIDVAPSEVNISATDAMKAEGDLGNTDFTFTVTRSGDTSLAGTVDYSVAGSGGNAAAASDFQGGLLPSGMVTFDPGVTSQTITVSVAGEVAVENDETFSVALSNPTSGISIDTGSATGTILNDDTGVSISADAAAKAEGDSGTTDFTFTVTRSGDLSGAGDVTYAASGNGATADDFAGGAFETGTVSFAAGENSQTVTIDVAGDLDVEAAENFTVTLSNATGGATIETATADGTIQNDDADLSIAADQASASEGESGATAFTFTVTRAGTEGARSVAWVVTGSGGNSADADDFVGGQLPSGTVSFADGQSTRTITVKVNGDSDVEPDEDFTVTLSNASGNTEITTATASSAIDNDDVQIDIEIVADDADKAEGDAGTAAFTFLVTRTGDTSGISTVDFAVAGAASNGASATDFDGNVLPSGTVTFNPDDTQALVTVLATGDTTVETDEGFTVTLSDAINAEIVTASASGTIRNDDSSLSIAALDSSQDEGDSGETTVFRFTVTRDGDTSGASSVDFAVSGDADADDFGGAVPSGTVSFAAGETSKEIQISVNGDDVTEGDEDFTVTLSDATGAAIATASASNTIVNDDLPPTEYDITAANSNRDERLESFTFTVTRSGNTTQATTVDFAVAGSGTNAADADDFGGTLPGGTVNFAAGQTEATVTVTVSNDADIEADETFTVTLANAGSSSATGTILNDDPEPESGVRLVDGELIVTGSDDAEVIIVRGYRTTLTVYTFNRATRDRTFDRFQQSDVVSITVDAKGGNDYVELRSRIFQESVIDLGDGNDRAYGGRRRDVINGGDGHDAIFGRNGEDIIDGGAGNDYIRGGNYNDILRGGSGTNWVHGDRGNDVVIGGEGRDFLYGQSGRDILIGGGGSDRLDGGGGDDILIGGTTSYDNDDAALTSLIAEWSSRSWYRTRVTNITTGGDLNGIKLEAGTTIQDDDAPDTLIGRGGRDFFFADTDGADRDRVFRNRWELFEQLP